MKKLMGLAVISILFFSACKKEVLPGADSGRSTAATTQQASSSGVVPYKSMYQYDLSDPRWSEFNSCTGELIKIRQGIWRIEGTFLFNVSGRDVYQFHTNTSNYKLYNAATGVEYTGSYASNTTFSVVDNGTEFSVAYTETLTVLLTTPGGGNNSILKADLHFTISASGIEAAYVDNFRAGCQ